MTGTGVSAVGWNPWDVDSGRGLTGSGSFVGGAL